MHILCRQNIFFENLAPISFVAKGGGGQVGAQALCAHHHAF